MGTPKRVAFEILLIVARKGHLLGGERGPTETPDPFALKEDIFLLPSHN